MDDFTRTWWLRPTTAHDPELVLDRVGPLAIDGQGRVTGNTATGTPVTGTVVAARDGALRLRLAVDASAPVVDSGMLADDYDEGPADPDVARAWLSRLSGMALLGTLTGPGLGTGPLIGGDGAKRGWQVSLPVQPDDAVYGGGECFQGIDLRGRVRRCVNLETHGAAGLDASYLTVPFFWTSGGLGIFVNSGAPVRADAAATHADVLALTVEESDLDVFLYAGAPAEILRQHAGVTGPVGSVPDWAFGVWTSRCSYFSADEVDRILDGYDEAECPVDVVHVDAWQVGDVIADLTTAWEVDRNRFPAGWGKRLADRGVRLSLWHNPYLRAGTAAGDDAVARGYVLRGRDGEPVSTNDMQGRLLVDFTNADARAWWRELVRDLLTDEGAVSVKCDFAEEVPPTAVTSDGRTGWQIRNSYALAYQRESHMALREATGGDAAIMFNRSGTAGAHRYPGHWVGDTPSTWSGLASAVRATLSLSMSGYSVVGSDVGGFWTERRVSPNESATIAWDEESYQADVDPELFARWTQWAVLTPLLRFHGTGKREPWAYPAPYGDVAVAATRLRPRLRSYLAAAAADSAAGGLPMMRPMPLAFPAEASARTATMQHLLGPDVLVAPIVQPGGQLTLWVPPGEWRGLAGAPDLTGPGWATVTLPLEAVPGWQRSGAEVLA